VLETIFNGTKQHPMAQKPWAGFDATTTIMRSDWNLGQFAPAVSDEVELMISVEAMPKE
jgi:polyisoprenoid-binding protein YceI